MKRIGTWRKTWQKLLCGATALALVLSLLPVGVLAAGEAPEPGLLITPKTTNSGLQYKIKLLDFGKNADDGDKAAPEVGEGLADGVYEIDFKTGEVLPTSLGFLVRYNDELGFVGVTYDVGTNNGTCWLWHYSYGSGTFNGVTNSNTPGAQRANVKITGDVTDDSPEGLEANTAYTIRVRYAGAQLGFQIKKQGEQDFSKEYTHDISAGDSDKSSNAFINSGDKGGIAIRFNGPKTNSPVLIQRIKQMDTSEVVKTEVDYTNYSGEWSAGEYATRKQQTDEVDNETYATLELVKAATTDPEPTTPEHHTEEGFIYPLLPDTVLKSATGWTTTKGNDPTFENGRVTFDKGGDNHIVWDEPINADRFMISMDVTVAGAAGDAEDLKIEFFKAEKENKGQRAVVRFKFQTTNDAGPSIKVGTVTVDNTKGEDPCKEDQTDKISDLTWGSSPLAIDILADRTTKTITVYVNGSPKGTKTVSLDELKQNYFGISGQYSNQNFTITNLSITTDKKPSTGGEGGGETTGPKHIPALTGTVRPLAEDNFETGDSWTTGTANASSSVTIGGGKAAIKGSGGDNYMAWASGPINADTFRISLDLTFNEGNTNGVVKIAFMGASANSTDRMQVRLACASSGNWLGIQKGDGGTSNDCAVFKSPYSWEYSKTYGIDVDVTKDSIILYIDAEQVLTLPKTKLDWTALGRGWFSIRSQYGAQDYTIENFSITTNEEQTGEPLPFTLGASEGGTVSVVSGAVKKEEDGKYYAYPGNVVTLEATANHGYVFDKWDTNTDSLLTVTNNSFTMVDDPVKFANLTITANFKPREASRFELWYDDFGYDTLNDPNHPKHNNKVSDNKYDVGESGYAKIENGALQLKTTDFNYLQIPEDIAEQLKGKNYRITVDAWMAEGTGTMQIMFNGKGDTAAERFANRTVAIVNQYNQALFKVFSSGTGGSALAQKDCDFKDTPVTYVLEVKENVATLIANGKEITNYDFTNTWTDGAAPAVALVNMSPALTVGYDNLKVELLPDTVSISAKTTLSGQADNNYTAGTVVPNLPTAVAGDKVTLETVVKAGYKLEGFTASGNYTGTVQFTDNKNGTWSFTVPNDASGTITVTANFVPVALPTARGYYIDSSAASGGDGTETRPWNSLIPLQTTVLNPGDTVYLKRGSVFDGQQLTFKGAGGTADKRITVTAYGEGTSLPRLNGKGAVTNVVELWNTPYVTIENLEITNTSPTYTADWSAPNKNNNQTVKDQKDGQALRAINIYAKNFGVVSGITIRNCYIHEVNGDLGAKWNGGIFFDIQASGVIGGVDGTIHGIPTKYDSCLVENNTLINVDRSAIKLVSSSWCNQSPDNNSKTTPANWYPSTNMVVRGNYMEKIGGDGITVRDVDGTLVEHNLAKDCNYQSGKTAYNVGIWPFQATNTVLQYNEAYNTHSTLDGQGLDCDHLSAYSVMQYNYSHNNEGGFMLIMGQWEHTSVTIRYNISQNDYDKLFEFTRGTPKGVMIYNNTFYSDTVISRGVMYLSNETQKIGLNDVYLFNNLFYLPASQPFYGGARANDIKTVTKPYNNGYAGGITPPAEEERAITPGAGEPVLVNPGKAPETYDASDRTAHTGSSGLLDGYQLAEGSPMIDAGVTVAEAIAHFNPSNLAIKDMKDKSPRDIYNVAYNNGNAKGNSTADGNASIQYVNQSPITISGVRYDVDFFGNGIVGAPDIGAAEFGGAHVHVLEKVEAVEPTCETDGNIAYWHCGNCGEYFKAESAGEGDKIQVGDTVNPATGHTLRKVAEVPATTSSTGVKEHWKCDVCDKLFEDEAGAHETTLEALTIPKLSSGTSSGTGSTGRKPSGNTSTTKTETVTTSEGVKGTTTKDQSGNVTSVEVTVPADVAEKGDMVVAPVEVESASSTAEAPEIDIKVSGGSAKVEIPVTNVGYGTVAVVVDENGNETILRDCVITADGVVLNVEGNVTVKIVENGKTFPDTVDAPWAEDAIAFTTARELFLGTGTNFEPNSNTDRATIVTLLYRLEYEPDIASVGFEDVVDDQWYANAVSWGQDSGVVMGYTDASFGPEDPVTREQVALMLYRYATHIGMDTTARAELSGFADGDQLSEWAADAMQWAVAIGLFTGHEGGFLDPTGSATRAQVAVLLMRFCEKKTLN